MKRIIAALALITLAVCLLAACGRGYGGCDAAPFKQPGSQP